MRATPLQFEAVPAPVVPPAGPREEDVLLLARHRQSVTMRWLLASLGIVLGCADALFDVTPAPSALVIGVPLAVAALNACASAWQHLGRLTPTQARLLLLIDPAALTLMAAAGGPVGFATLPFYVMVVGGHALGFPELARVQLLVVVVLHPVARLLSARLLGFPLSPGALLIEGGCLAGVGWLATVAPAITTARLRRARAALAALQRGDFTARLPERASDDLGLLAASFNRTAHALGESVAQLETAIAQHDAEVAEHERAKTALRESEARLWIAQSEAQGTAARMRAVANAAAGVLAADSLAALHDVMRAASRQVIAFDAFALALHDGTGEWAPVGASDPELLTESLQRLVLERRAALRMVARGGREGRKAAGSVLLAPLTTAEGVLGVVALRSETDGAYSEADVEVIEVLANLATTAVRNTTLVHELRCSKEAFAHQAYHDPLTGLANRARMRERLAHVLSRRDVGGVAVLMLDLDGFKRVNDSLGHAAGDQLLCEVSKRLLNATRGCDTVVRLGGDEFAVLLENARMDADATTVAERVLSAMRVPFQLNGAEAVVGTSIGIARPVAVDAADASLGVDDRADALLRDADLAMYRAKARGKGRWAVFEPEMHAEAVARLAMEADLRAALERSEFSVLFQPIVSLDDGEPLGVEALVRWQHPQRGTMMPSDFVPVAEETGLIGALGGWVLRHASARVAGWNTQRAGLGRPPLTLTVNVSARQIYEPGFVDEVLGVLAQSGLQSGQLLLEITESVMLDRPELARERFEALRRAGVRLAVDDFGTGYSALGYLQRFPIDTLKIDKSFVDGLRRGGSQAALARTIVALGRALSLRTIAEGIEDEDQRAALRDAGCVYGQGFLFHGPLPAGEAEALLLARRDRPSRRAGNAA
ncbi:EAL domain-containing protein [Roseisolibacter sp. H3M3-2]|uniref:putative bifunctional diguanylate cyclase/phosphodiesterase n=1 Tax=Roseisolibacter sp. H3M3-2 TaxID=3031323 RepID=UPI0023DBFAFC|nr:EAL domain-containing protein [Roseisolibacter sp. H3M3-2]MDF1501445.1 EAL domain-containing protein [Roseisolibacter sp. H3M3-2]